MTPATPRTPMVSDARLPVIEGEDFTPRAPTAPGTRRGTADSRRRFSAERTSGLKVTPMVIDGRLNYSTSKNSEGTDSTSTPRREPLGTKEWIEKVMKSPSNFERLVLGCMDSYDSDQILILQHFSRSTRFSYFCTAQI